MTPIMEDIRHFEQKIKSLRLQIQISDMQKFLVKCKSVLHLHFVAVISPK